MKGKKVLVTGGAGFIGSNIVNELKNENEVTVLDNLNTGRLENIENAMNDGVKFIKADVKELSNFKEKFEIVFHLGFYSSSPMYNRNPYLVGEVVSGMISVLEYCRKNDAQLVFSSTSSIYNGIDPPHREDCIPRVTDYYTEARIASERLGELYHRLYGLNVAGMRFFSVYGYNDIGKGQYANLITQFMVEIKNGRQPVIYGDGTQRRDFIFVTDVVDAVIRAASTKGFGIYNVGTGTSYSLNEIVEKLNTALNKNVRPKYVPMPIKNYVMVTQADMTKSRTELGFFPKVDVDRGIELLKKSMP
ncbi:MAG: NAD-dependent epimerase/dehydratase family protein [Thermoplasmatales archaeon]